MIITKDYNIASCDDFELGIKRDSKLHFKLSYDDSKEIKAILCVIAGLGADAQDSYKDHLVETIANELDLAVLSVDYHCCNGLNESKGAKRHLDRIDKIIFKQACAKVGFILPSDFDERSDDFEFVSDYIGLLNSHIYALKAQKKLDENFKLAIHWSLKASNEDYQNMGIMSAIDVINALLYLKSSKAFKSKFERLPSILLGSSHGGYIANLASKIAPWCVNAVIDNSSWNLDADISLAEGAFKMVGFGKEIDYTQCSIHHALVNNLIIWISSTTKWTFDRKSPYYFSASRHQIRNVNNLEHLKSQEPKSIYIGYHSTHDEVAKCSKKIDFYNNLKALGFDATLHVIKGDSDIDGKLIKTLEHAMDMSIKTLILKEVPPLLAKLKNAQKCDKKSIGYSTDEWIYNFKESRNKLILSCDKI